MEADGIIIQAILAFWNGAEIECYEPIPLDHHMPIMLDLGGNEVHPTLNQAWMWCDVLVPSTAKVIARYKSEFYAERTAATLNQYGNARCSTLERLASKVSTTLY